MVGFFAGVVLVSVLGGPLLLGLLVGALAAVLARPLRRDPPWTRAGRAAWRGRMRRVASVIHLVRVQSTRRGGVGGVWVDPRHARSAERFDAVLRVRCEAVGERTQVWHADGTGRAFEVAPNDAPLGTAVGDEGWLHVEGGRARVRPLAPRVLN